MCDTGGREGVGCIYSYSGAPQRAQVPGVNPEIFQCFLRQGLLDLPGKLLKVTLSSGMMVPEVCRSVFL